MSYRARHAIEKFHSLIAVALTDDPSVLEEDTTVFREQLVIESFEDVAVEKLVGGIDFSWAE